MNPICQNLQTRTREEESINIQPIQAGGRLTPEAMKAMIAYGDGYSVCDLCLKPFRLDFIKKPNIADFYTELAEFVNMDVARVMPGARRCFQAVIASLVDKNDVVLVSELGHYTLCLAVENEGGDWREIPKNDQNIITKEATSEKIEKVKAETGKLPKLIAVSHFDYQLANEHDVKGIAKVAHEHDIPFLYNGAYTVGIMPVDGKKLGADFVVGSGHKSMAAAAPTGLLAVNDEYKDKIFATTEATGDVSGKKFGIKEKQLLGCTVMGAPLLSLMASFPRVRERVKNWAHELDNARRFIDAMLKIEGTKVVSEMPRKHTLTKIGTWGFDKVAQKHKKKGFFLTSELSKRDITGPFPGATKEWKLNTYGCTDGQIDYLIDAFIEIAKENGLEVE